MTKKSKRKLRMCVSCRQMKTKEELFRIVRQADETLSVDTTMKQNGRGAYVCKDKTCIERLEKSHGLEKALKCKGTQAIIEELKAFYL